MPFKVNVSTKEPGVFVVAPYGSIDSEGAEQLDKAMAPLLKPETKVIIMNMKDVDMITSMGLGCVFKAKRYLAENNAALMMSELSPRVKKIFELVRAIPEYLFASMTEVDACLDAFLKEMERIEDEKGKGRQV